MVELKKNLKILIVDDNETDLELLEAILVKIGFEQVFTAKSGPEAFELLKESPATQGIPVIYISGIISKAEESQLGGQLASGDLIVAKPFSVTSIAEVMVTALKRTGQSYQ